MFTVKPIKFTFILVHNCRDVIRNAMIKGTDDNTTDYLYSAHLHWLMVAMGTWLSYQKQYVLSVFNFNLSPLQWCYVFILIHSSISGMHH